MSLWFERPRRVPSVTQIEAQLRGLGLRDEQIERHVSRLRECARKEIRKREHRAEEAGATDAADAQGSDTGRKTGPTVRVRRRKNAG